VATLVPPLADSALALTLLRLDDGSSQVVNEAELDSLVYVLAGTGTLALDGAAHALEAGNAALVLAGEEAELRAAPSLELVHATVGPAVDVHAPLGVREVAVRVDARRAEQALASRGYQVLFGPHNGSARATLFAGYLPPGRSPWHFHLYDEIVFVPQGPGMLHRPGSEEPLEQGAAFRLRPREVHIVENARTEGELTILGIFTPAGSPSAAYLAEVDER
jgi:quercetin dioxygenase-like cupin family protein